METEQNVKVRGCEDGKGEDAAWHAFVTYPAKSAQGQSPALCEEERMTLGSVQAKNILTINKEQINLALRRQAGIFTLHIPGVGGGHLELLRDASEGGLEGRSVGSTGSVCTVVGGATAMHFSAWDPHGRAFWDEVR